MPFAVRLDVRNILKILIFTDFLIRYPKSGTDGADDQKVNVGLRIRNVVVEGDERKLIGGEGREFESDGGVRSSDGIRHMGGG